LSPEAFAHLPHLREKMVAPGESRLRVTPEVLKSWDERARQIGRPADWRISDAEREQNRRAVLGQRDPGSDPGNDLWIYAYGSLMWDPGFHFAEVRLARLTGYARRFSYRTVIGRGSPEHPGLMLTLEETGGDCCCTGLAFRIPAAQAEAESTILWRREMVRGGYRPIQVQVATPQGAVSAVVFACNHDHPDYVGELTLAQTAATIARGTGMNGSNRQYLEQLAEQLAHLGLEDQDMTRLLQEVRACGGAGVTDELP